jgi:hypothetical protein
LWTISSTNFGFLGEINDDDYNIIDFPEGSKVKIVDNLELRLN